jgi:hypothetical protein
MLLIIPTDDFVLIIFCVLLLIEMSAFFSQKVLLLKFLVW